MLAYLDEQEVRLQISRITELPPMPQAFSRLLRILRDEIASAGELESIIKYDQSISSRVLRMANSSYFGYRGGISSISRAIVILGFRQVRQMVMNNLLMEFFSSSKIMDYKVRESLWKHAYKTARIASELARRRPWVESELAYMLGLLHDIGKVILASAFSEQYRSIGRIATHRQIPSLYVEEQFGLSHALLGKWVAIRWALPEIFQNVIAYHHCPHSCPSNNSEIMLVFLSDVLANANGHPELIDDELTGAYCQKLCISGQEWRKALNYVLLLDEEVDEMWNLLR